MSAGSGDELKVRGPESPSGLSFGTGHPVSKRDEGTPTILKWQPCSGMYINRLTQRAGIIALVQNQRDAVVWDGK